MEVSYVKGNRVLVRAGGRGLPFSTAPTVAYSLIPTEYGGEVGRETMPAPIWAVGIWRSEELLRVLVAAHEAGYRWAETRRYPGTIPGSLVDRVRLWRTRREARSEGTDQAFRIDSRPQGRRAEVRN